jgi:glycosyltransferase involved in cell wall biosynthesis
MNFFIEGHVLDDLSQGSKTYLKGLYGAVFDLNHEDKFFVATNNTSSFESEINPHSNVYQLQYSHHNRFARLGWDIPQLIKENKIDWAHYQYISPIVKTTSEIVTIHDLLFLDYPEYFPLDYRLVKNYLFKRSARRADWVLTVSKFSKQALIRHYNINPDRIVITPNGVLDLFLDESNEQEDACSKRGLDQFILYVSRIEPRKNQLGLLRSYLDLQLWRQGIQLVFVGGVGIRTPEFEKRYQSLDDSIRKMIFFFSDLSLPELKQFYKKCLLFVYPSLAEGFGIPPLEALACGSNVICSNTTAMSEFQFLNERLFDPNDKFEMTQKIDFFLKNPQTENFEAMQGYLRTHYSWELSAKRFLGLFK